MMADPAGGAKWRVPWTLGVVELVCWGTFYYAFAVFLPAMQQDLGWSQAVLTSAYSLSMVVRGVAAIPVGQLLDRHGARGLMIMGVGLGVVTLLGWARIDSYLVLYAVFVSMGLVTATVLYEPAFALVVRAFGERRDNALLVVTVIGGLASTVFLPLTVTLVAGLGWRRALLVLAAVLVVGAMLPLLALVREPRSARPRTADVRPANHMRMAVVIRHAIRSRPFLWLTIASFLSYLTVVAVSVHLVSYLMERGYSAQTAAIAVGALGVLSVLGRVAVTGIARRLRLARLTAALVVCQAIAVVPLLALRDVTGLVLFVLLFGAGFGVLTIARASLLADYAPKQMYGRYAGLQAFVVTMAQVVAPAGGSVLRGWLGYPVVFIFCAVLSAAAAAALLLADHTSRADADTVADLGVR